MKRIIRRKKQKRMPVARKRTIKALAAGAAIAAGTQAYADPVRFDNPPAGEPGHFQWAAFSPGGGSDLDFTLPAADQPAAEPGTTVLRHQYDTSWGIVERFGTSNTQLQTGYDLVYGFLHLLEGVNAGDLIPSGTLWNSYGYTDGNYGTLLPEGTPTYLGVRFDLGDGNQYGWIGIVRDGYELDAFAWGYETEPGVPIKAGIPEPGTLAALAFGVAFAGLARRRS